MVIEENCTLTSCLIDSNVKIGSSSHVQGGGKIERYSILLPGTVVSPGFTVPSFTVYGGSPARYVRDTTPEDINEIEQSLKDQSSHAKRNKELLESLGH